MNNQSCFQAFIRYSVLSILGMLGVSCYILADTFFISKGLGINGLTALNLAIPVYNFIHGCGLMLGMGGATKFSISKSRKEREKTDIIYTNTVCVAIGISLLFMLVGLFMSGWLAEILGADAEVFEMTNIYLRWLLIFAPAFIINDVLLCFVRNDDEPRLSMIAMLVGSFSNIILDYIFIFPMQMGIFGAIFATGLSPVISIVMMLPHWFRRKNTFHIVKTRVYGEIIRQELALGFPSLLAQVSSGIVMILFNIIILRLEGNIGVAAYGVIANVALVVVAVYTGLAQGVQPLVSNFYGAGDENGIRLLLRYAMTMMLSISIIIYVILFVFARPIVGVFNSENHMQLQEIAEAGVKLYFISNIFAGYNIVIAVFFTSVEKTVPAHVLSLLRGLILIVPVAFILAIWWGMTGVWLAYPITEFLVTVLGVKMYQHYVQKG